MKKKLFVLLLLILISFSGCSNNNSTGNDAESNKKVDVTESEKTLANELLFQKESDHFRFYCINKDIEVLEDLTKKLEDNYERITNDLKTYPEEKTDIYIYSDVETFHESLDMTNSPGWVVGKLMNNKEVHMVSPSNPGEYHDYDSILRSSLHSFTRVVIMNLNTITPAWLSAGVPAYESQDNISFPKDFKEEKIPELTQLESPSSMNQSIFGFGYTLVEFIVEKYGYDTLIDLIKKPDNYEDIFGFNKEEFEKQWRTYIIDKYIK